MSKLGTWLRERVGPGESPAMLEGGASFAYVFGKVLVFLLVFEGVTGAALAAFYSPSTSDAWASVAYIQDQSALGWLVRGVHHHGGGAIVVVAGLHLVQTAVAGAYKKPRELVWWLGVLLLILTVVWAVTGYVLRYDQEGYWANRVELGIAAGTPLVGGKIRDLALGGNDYGNLTLTRFYALHAIVFPAIVVLLTAVHIKLARKHGITPVRSGPAVPRSEQSLRDALAMLLTTVILFGVVGAIHGATLTGPADPGTTFDARPLWYFRWLFELREMAGSAEKLAALVAPAIVGGFLIMLPLLDKSPDRAPRARKLWLGALAGMFALIGGLTAKSFLRDANDSELAERRIAEEKSSARARELAMTNGVPATGALDVWSTPAMYKARKLFKQKCAGCHAADSKDRKGPIIGPGHGDRAWLKAFLLDPSGDRFWGRTKLVADSKKAQEIEKNKPKEPPPDDKGKDKKPDGKKDDKKPDGKKDDKKPDDKKPDDKKPEGPQDLAMAPVDVKGAELDAVVEWLYAESGATDANKKLAENGKNIFDSTCNDCHTATEEAPGQSGPNLFGVGSRAYYFHFIGNPKSQVHMTEAMSSMPRFDKELSATERDALAEYLVWLRTATQAQLDALGPL